MAAIYDDITRTVGGTPLVRLNSLTKGLNATLLAKLEMNNPLGSVKDRIGVAMIEAAEAKGLIGRTLSLWSRQAGIPGLPLPLYAQ